MTIKMKFNRGCFVYCVDNDSVYSNTSVSNIDKLELNKRYTIKNGDCGNNDIELEELPNIYYAKSRFVCELVFLKDKIFRLKGIIKQPTFCWKIKNI